MKRRFRIEIDTDHPDGQAIVQTAFGTLCAMLDHEGKYVTEAFLGRLLWIDGRVMAPPEDGCEDG